jgi:hypothetical protein
LPARFYVGAAKPGSDVEQLARIGFQHFRPDLVNTFGLRVATDGGSSCLEARRYLPVCPTAALHALGATDTERRIYLLLQSEHDYSLAGER